MKGLDENKQCSKCGARSGDDWSQCQGVCPVECSPHYAPTERRVKRADVRVGDTYDVYGTEWVPSLRQGRVVKLVIDNTDENIVPFYQAVIRFDEGRPDRVLSGPEIDYYLRRRP